MELQQPLPRKTKSLLLVVIRISDNGRNTIVKEVARSLGRRHPLNNVTSRFAPPALLLS